MPRARRAPRCAARAAAAACSATVRRPREARSPRRSRAAGPASSTITSRPKASPLDNAAIARVLREIADLLEIKGDNPFKIRAYRNGADILANHHHELTTLHQETRRQITG